jgi:hypothetical protein
VYQHFVFLFALVRRLCPGHAAVVLSIGVEEVAAGFQLNGAMRKFGYTVRAPANVPSMRCAMAASVFRWMEGEAALRSVRFASLWRYACLVGSGSSSVPDVFISCGSYRDVIIGRGREKILATSRVRRGPFPHGFVALVRWRAVSSCC